MNLGMALREKGEAEKALEHLRIVAESDPANAGAYYELGQTLRQTGDLDGAIKAFEKSVELDPELREGYYGLAQVLKQQGASARVAATAAPASDERFGRAQDAAARGDLAAARAELTPLLAEQPEHADAHSLMGYVLGQLGQLPAALQHLERAVALRPEWADARYNLGAALLVQRRTRARDRGAPREREARSRGGAELRNARNRAPRAGRPRGRAGEPAARDCAAAPDRRGVRRSRHRVSPRRRSPEGHRTAESRV